MLKILVIGSGGREHALAWRLSRSWRVGEVYVAPGNAGTEWTAAPCIEGYRPWVSSVNVNISADDVSGIIDFCREKAIDLVVVGPEAPLAAGMVDALKTAGIVAFGPTQAAARLESSKAFAKQFMRDHNIPTAEYGTFTDYAEAAAFVESFGRPVVVKADGLAAGKGVIVCDDMDDARSALAQILLEDNFGAAGNTVVIEERLEGPEVSVLAFSDGNTMVAMPPARDHKRAFDGDEGPNTGGMGAYAPVPDVGPDMLAEIVRTILQPAVDGMAGSGTPYMGVLYAGIMLTESGPELLEFNCRFGDPEAQVILPLLVTDFAQILLACVEGTLADVTVEWEDDACATVVAASPGYPGHYPKGLPIEGVQQVREAVVFHAGTIRQEGRLKTAGGRVLAVTAVGADLYTALKTVYREIKKIRFEGMHYRTDIGR